MLYLGANNLLQGRDGLLKTETTKCTSPPPAKPGRGLSEVHKAQWPQLVPHPHENPRINPVVFASAYGYHHRYVRVVWTLSEFHPPLLSCFKNAVCYI